MQKKNPPFHRRKTHEAVFKIIDPLSVCISEQEDVAV